MGQICTCGANPPDDAQFCHRCGRPLFAEPPPEVQDTAPSIPAVEPVAVEVSFRNSNAVTISFLTAACLFLLLPFAAVGGGVPTILLLLGAGGLFAAIVYGRRTGNAMSVMSGARMGWMTGVFFNAILVLFLTAAVLVLEQQGGAIKAWEQQSRAAKVPEAEIQAALQALQSPAQFIVGLAVTFMLFTLPMILGGAVAAKMLDRGSSEA
ncbi:MAG: zinc ribbon domain-containing protein [Acidobacteria bacterium]|nr:zinc ribbon domain-containing protein [Acidobacteriota bacterium]